MVSAYGSVGLAALVATDELNVPVDPSTVTADSITSPLVGRSGVL